MRSALSVLIVALLALASPVSAHRLDEYLEAATMGIEQDHVALTLRLTPGVAVADRVLAEMDSGGDAIPSEANLQSYAGHVREDLSLSIDGKDTPLRLLSASSSPRDVLQDGGGEITLAFEAAFATDSGPHALSFENRHERAIAVYMVNALLPRDAAIHIVNQERSHDQSLYKLSFTSDAATSSAATPGESLPMATFFRHGVRHILTGYDHLLFIGALVLGAATLWDLVAVVTAFTVAHSITLTLAALELVHVPSSIVEPLISASIVFVAARNILSPGASRGWSRLIVAFLFGLFHGLGFAGGLIDLLHQMPWGATLLAILGFSLGIEAGNQIVLLPLFGMLKLVDQSSAPLSRAIRLTGSALVAAGGAYFLYLALS